MMSNFWRTESPPILHPFSAQGLFQQLGAKINALVPSSLPETAHRTEERVQRVACRLKKSGRFLRCINQNVTRHCEKLGFCLDPG